MSGISRKLKRKKRPDATPDPLLRKAIAFFNKRNWQDADALCRELIRKNPRHHKALNLLAVILTNKPDLEQAEKCVREAIRIMPTEPAYLGNLGLILKESERWEESFKAFEQAYTLNPNDAETLYNLGTVYQALKQEINAKEKYRKAISINPRHVQALCALCNLLGRRKESREELDKVMSHMEAILSEPGIQSKEQLCFEFARTHDKLGHYDRVFLYLDPANRMVRERFKYDAASEREFFYSIETVFTQDYFRDAQEYGSDDTSPIFIVGMPRSGTTLVEQILASHSLVAAGGELHVLNSALLQSPHFSVPFRPDTIKLPNYSKLAHISAADLKGFAEAYLKGTASLRKGRRYLTDKMPHNFIHVGMIKLLFPHCKVIHCRRDPMDNGLSLYMQNFKVLHSYMYTLSEIGEYYAGYHHLMNHWQKILPGFIHDVRYEELVQKPEREIQALLDYCGLEWEQTCLEFYKLKRTIKTASEGQADQPLYTSSIGRWKNYEKQLQPLRDVLLRNDVVL